MPLGSDLTGDISKLLSLSVEFAHRVTNGDQAIYNAIRHAVNEENWGENQFIRSSRAVADAMQLAHSIDTFLESHGNNREFIRLGKLGIARAILLAEAKSKFKPSKNGTAPFVMTDLAHTWYYSLARQMFSGVPAERPNLAFSNVRFIVFNYDRCLQVFLTRAAEIYFRISTQQASELIKNVQFIHPYGYLGSIFEHAPDCLPFAPGSYDLNAVAARIKTFSESSDRAEEIVREVRAAETIIFLGFGFHEQNMKLLEVGYDYGTNDPPPKRVFATTKDLSRSDEEVVRAQISYALWGTPEPPGPMSSIYTNNGTCAELFSAYWRSLTT